VRGVLFVAVGSLKVCGLQYALERSGDGKDLYRRSAAKRGSTGELFAQRAHDAPHPGRSFTGRRLFRSL